MTSLRVTSVAEDRYAPICFGPYSVHPVSGELRKDGMEVHLSRQASQLLLMLLHEPGRIRTREELKRILWPGESFGDFDQGLNKAVHSLRAALGDPARSPRLIETLSGRGYRFIGSLGQQKSATVAPQNWQEMPMAVVPFSVASGELTWISLKIAMQVIDQLSRVEGVRVLAFSEVRGLPKDEIKLLPERFGVRAIVTGDLNVEGEELFVHGEMMDSLDGTQMWGLHTRVLLGKHCAAKVAELIVSEVRRAQLQGAGSGARREGEGTTPWSRFGRMVLERWRSLAGA